MPGTQLTPTQERVRSRLEGMIGLAAPFLDLVLAVGERVSRIAEPDDPGYYPARPGSEPGLFEGRSPEASSPRGSSAERRGSA